MPAHWGSRRLNLISGSSPIATQIPHAAGIAYAMKYRKEDAVVGCWFGDGATSEGDWHEGLNFSGIHRLPVVWVCENNLYAISVPLSKQMAVKEVSVRAEAYGFPGETVDGNDVLACYEAMKTAVDRARGGEGPTLLEVRTYRFHPHTSDDDDRTYGGGQAQRSHPPLRRRLEGARADRRRRHRGDPRRAEGGGRRGGQPGMERGRPGAGVGAPAPVRGGGFGGVARPSEHMTGHDLRADPPIGR